MTVQVQFRLGHPIDLGDYPGPVQLAQGADERSQPEKFVTGAGKQLHLRPPGAMAV